MTQPATGGCLCGAIRYTVTAPLANIAACHCSNCRRISGAGSSHNAIVPSTGFAITQGTPKRYQDTAAASGNVLYRHFCDNCGSSLYSQRAKNPEFVVLKVGTLDDASGMRIAMNIWTESAYPWMHIDAAAVNHPQNRPA